jgi:hypothetical protein
MMAGPICPGCGKEAILVPKSVIYGEDVRNDGNAWVCPDWPGCDYYIGCQPGPFPLPAGTMAGPRLRGLRSRIHSALRPIYESGGGKTKVLKQTARKMGWGNKLNVAALDEKKCLDVLAIVAPGFREDEPRPISWQDERD